MLLEFEEGGGEYQPVTVCVCVCVCVCERGEEEGGRERRKI